MTNKDQCREDFEAWARGLPENVNLIREGSGYRYVYAECSWEAWQAARSAPASPLSDEQIDALPIVIRLRERIKHWKRESAKRYVEGWNDSAEQEGARSAPAAPVELPEPVLFVSAGQLGTHTDPGAYGVHGSYLPARKTAAGLFTAGLYTEQQVRELLSQAGTVVAETPESPPEISRNPHGC